MEATPTGEKEERGGGEREERETGGGEVCQHACLEARDNPAEEGEAGQFGRQRKGERRLSAAGGRQISF